MKKTFTVFHRVMLLALALGTGYTSWAQVIPQPVAVTGFNADIVANGSGNATAGSSSNSSVDANSYVFHSNDYTTTTAPGFFHPNVGLPFGRAFLGAGTATPAVQYQLQPYTGNNSLRLYGVGGTASPAATAVGTLTFTTPAPAGTLYVLATSGSGADATTALVNFSDGTSQSINFTVQDWFSGTPYAFPVNNRVLITGTNFDALTANTAAANPRLYQYALTLSAANASKNITSVTFTKSTTAGSYVQIMAISAAPAAAYTPMVLTFPAAGPPAPLNSTFITPSVSGQDMITNGLVGNTITAGTTTTPYSNTSATADTDGAGYFLTATDYNKSTAAHDTYGLPVAGINGATTTGLLSSLITSGLNYQLADYSGINALQIRGIGTGSVNFTGTSATEVYVLTTSTNSGTVTGGMTVNFSDGTSHSYAASYTNWFTTVSSTATQTTAGVTVGVYAKGRLQPGNTVQTSTTSPYLFENKLLLSTSEYAKTVTSVTVSNPSSSGVLSVLGVTLNTPSSAAQCTYAAGHSAAASVATACAGTTFNLNVLGLSAALGYTYQWQYSTDNANWNNLTNSTSASPYSTNPTAALCPVLNQTAATYYRCLVQCAFDQASNSSPSASIQVGQTDPINCYSYPNVSTSGCTAAGSVTAVQIAELATATVVMNKTGLSCATTTEPYSTYGIFRDANSNGTLDKAKDYKVTVSVSNTSRLGVWMDLNRDGVFNSTANSAGTPTGEYFGTTNLTTSTGGTLIINIPATALGTVTNGVVGLRIRTESGSATVLSTAGNNNATTVNGITLDYAVIVTGATPCAGAPTATSSTASVGTACPGTTFTLTAQGPALGTTGLTYLWEYKLSAGGTYASVPATITDVNGNAVATNSTGATLTIVNQRAATDYRVTITCTASGSSAVSPATTIAQSALANCYCQNANNATNEYLTNVTLNTINNTSGSSQSNTPTGYMDYSASPTATQTTTLNRGGTYSLSVTALSVSSTPTEMVWIDYDQSGTFDANEYVFSATQSSTGSVTGSLSITIPATALLGSTRMRVRYHNDASGTSSSACANAWIGETEDYRVTIGAALVCSGTPPTTIASTTVSTVCGGTSFTLSSTGIAAGTTGLTYQWQSSPASAGTFSDITGATAATYTVTSQTTATDYRLVVTCTASSLSANSNVVSVAQNAVANCYCQPTSSSVGEYLSNVTVGSINNSSGNSVASTPTGYTDYTASPTATQTTNLGRGTSYPVTITAVDGRINSTGIMWIDYDHSGTFDATNSAGVTEYLLIGSGPTSGSFPQTLTFTNTLAIPASALLGTTHMRVRWHNDATTASDACTLGWNGETEEYLVNIIVPTGCTGTPATATASASASTVCGGTSFTLSATGINTTIGGLTYQWQNSPAGAGTFTAISGATTNPYTVASQTAATDYRLVVTCTASSLASNSNVVSVAQNSFLSCYCTPVTSGISSDNITRVVLTTPAGTLTNSSAATSTSPYYTDYSATQTAGTLPIPTLYVSGTATVAITMGTDGNQYSGVWIDFDHSGTFDTNEYFTAGTNAGASGTSTFTITVPASALSGQTKMRVRGGNDVVLLNTQSCTAASSTSNYGEVEDYLVTISSTTPDLTVSTTTTIPAGTYNNVTITPTGNGTLTGATVVNGYLMVSTGGTLHTACQPLTGAGTFMMAAGATLDICDPQGITLSGATGAIQLATRLFSVAGTYIYSGNAAQVTGSALPARVRNLTVSTSNGAALTLSQPVAIRRLLTLTTGNVLNGQNLTLRSDADSTALVSVGSGIVSGAATVQRYISPAPNAGLGYRHFSAPVTNTTVADFATASFSPSVSQGAAYNASATPGAVTPFPTVFGYNEARQATSPATGYSVFDRGWQAPTVTSDALQSGKGYTVNLAAGQMVDFVGTLGTGNVALPLTRGTTTNPGWNLVGNPYPSTLNWDNVTIPTGMDAAVYVYRSTSQYAGSYTSYTNGLGTSGGRTATIGMGQAFFVRVSPGSTAATLTLTDAARSADFSSNGSFQRSNDPRPRIRMALENASADLTDAAYVYFENGATAGIDARYDAVKLANPSGLSLSAVAAGTDLAINGLPALGTATTVPLTVAVPQAGTYTLRADELLNLATGPVYLLDALTGQQINLLVQPSYTFSATGAARIAGRFSLGLPAAGPLATQAGLSAASVSVYPNPAHTSFTVLVPAVPGAKQVQMTLFNSLGQRVREQAVVLGTTGAETAVDVKGLASGIYTLRLQVAGQAAVARRVTVE